MSKLSRVLLAAVALSIATSFALPSTTSAKLEDGWEYVTTDEGVVLYKKEVEGSDLVAFKGVTYANLPIGKILSVFRDSEQRKHWVDRYAEHKTLEKGPETETYWIHFKLPPLVSDRDYILRADGKADPAKHAYVVNIKSVMHPAKGEDDCCVRAQVYGTFYEFVAIPGEEKTKITVEVHTDPKGSLPSWLVNLIQKSWPRKTLNGLINHVKASNPAVLPEFADWHKAAPAGTKTATTAAQ